MSLSALALAAVLLAVRADLPPVRVAPCNTTSQTACVHLPSTTVPLGAPSPSACAGQLLGAPAWLTRTPQWLAVPWCPNGAAPRLSVLHVPTRATVAFANAPAGEFLTVLSCFKRRLCSRLSFCVCFLSFFV